MVAFTDPDLMGNIRFGCAEDYTHRFLSAVLAGFRTAFPNIRVDIHSAPGVDLYRMLQGDELDLCLLDSMPVGEHFRIRRNQYSNRVPVLLPCHFRRRPGGASGTCGLGGGPFGLRPYGNAPAPGPFYHEGCLFRAMALEGLQQAGIEYWISVVSPSISSILAAVKAGLAVAPVGASMLDDSP